jgi:hypothetical protein
MDHNERISPRSPVGDWSTMSGSPTSGSSGAARQHARNKGLAWVSAITLGAGAASALGATAIALTLPSTTAATTASAGTAATSASQGTGDDSGSTQQAAPLQAAPAPASSNNAPVATSAAS